MRVGVVVLALVAASSVARGEMPSRLMVAGQGGCPAAAAVARALERLHPRLRADAADGVRVEVVDRGGRYEVRAAEATRTLEDPERRCGERATAAAVAVTLLLDPPVAPAPEEPEGPLAPRESPPPQTAPSQTAPPQPPPSQMSPSRATPPPTAPSQAPLSQAPPSQAPPSQAPPSQAPPSQTPPSQTPPPQTPPTTTTTTPRPTAPTRAAPTPTPAAAAPTPTATVARPRPPLSRSSRPSRIDLELTGVLDGAPTLGTAAAELTGGASLRLALGGRYVAATVGFAGLAPATATSSTVAVRVVRIPFDAGVRLALPVGRVEPGLDAGLALAILQLSAPALADAATNTRLDVGARIAPFLRIGLTSRLALVFGLEMIVSFAPYDLVVDPAPQTKIATTPRLWLGGGLGLAARL